MTRQYLSADIARQAAAAARTGCELTGIDGAWPLSVKVPNLPGFQQRADDLRDLHFAAWTHRVGRLGRTYRIKLFVNGIKVISPDNHYPVSVADHHVTGRDMHAGSVYRQAYRAGS